MEEKNMTYTGEISLEYWNFCT